MTDILLQDKHCFFSVSPVFLKPSWGAFTTVIGEKNGKKVNTRITARKKKPRIDVGVIFTRRSLTLTENKKIRREPLTFA